MRASEFLDISYTLMFGPIRGPEVFSNLQSLREFSRAAPSNAMHHRLTSHSAKAIWKWVATATTKQFQRRLRPCLFSVRIRLLSCRWSCRSNFAAANLYVDNAYLSGDLSFITSMPSICKFKQAIWIFSHAATYEHFFS